MRPEISPLSNKCSNSDASFREIDKKIDKIENLAQNIENIEYYRMQHISNSLKNQNEAMKIINDKTNQNLELVAISNDYTNQEYREIHQKAFRNYIDKQWNTQNEIKTEIDKNINRSIDKSHKKIDRMEHKIEKEFKKAFPTPKGVKNREGILPEDKKTDDNNTNEKKPDENKPRDVKPEIKKPEQQIKKDNHKSEDKTIKKSENLGNNKGSKQDKNVVHGKSGSVSENSTKNTNKNLQTEKIIGKTVKPGNMTKEKIKTKNENLNKNLIETRLREMKEKDTKSEVKLAELDPKTAENDLKKLPEPYQDKKDKKIEKIENKFNNLTQKLENVENQLLQDISKTLNSQTKEKNEIEDKTNQNLDFIHNSNKDLELDQIHEEAYHHYVDELMKAHNEIEKKTNGIIDKKIDEKQKEIDKIDEKIKKAFDKAFPTPKGVEKSDRNKIKENEKGKRKSKG